MLLPSLVLVTVLAYRVHGANDWSKPCFDGECAYDLPGSTGSSGIFKLRAHPKGLTDITPAAGWVLLECDPHILEQDIRLVCETDHSQSGCQHIFDYSGPVNKVVRLPESCGNGPFARISGMHIAEDQSVPSHLQNRLRRRDGESPQVHVMTIDSNWSRLDRAKSGDIFFTFIGVTSPGVDLNSAMADFSWDPFDFSEWVKDAAQKVTTKVREGVDWIGKKWDEISIPDPTHFQIKPTVQSSPVVLNGGRRFSQDINIGCSADAELQLDVNATGSITIKAGAIIAGNFLGEKIIEEIGLFGGINGKASAALHIGLTLEGGFDTGEQKIMSDVGLPGLSIGGVFTIGPFLSLAARAQGQLAVDISADLNLTYSFSDVEVWFPQDLQSHSLLQGISNSGSDLGFSASGKAQARGVLQGTLIPSINFGIAVAGGEAADVSASLGVEVWSRASAEVTAEATGNTTLSAIKAISAKPLNKSKAKHVKGAIRGKAASGHTKAGGRSKKASSIKPAKQPKAGKATSKEASRTKIRKGKAASTRKSPKKAKPSHSKTSRRSLPSLAARDASAGLSACFWIEAGIDLVASARGSIFKWEVNTGKYSILETEPPWELFSKCWTAGEVSDASEKPTWAKDLLSKSSNGTCKSGAKLPEKVKDKVQGKSLAP